MFLNDGETRILRIMRYVIIVHCYVSPIYNCMIVVTIKVNSQISELSWDGQNYIQILIPRLLDKIYADHKSLGFDKFLGRL